MFNFLLSIPSGFDLFGLHINFYGIISASSYLLGVIVTCLLAKKRGFKVDDIVTLACYVIPLAVIGARLYYVLFRLEYYTNFWDIFKIWEGGLAFYGGLIGGALGVILFCIIHKKNFFALIDIIAPALIISQALGRWGNFFNQEAYGYEVTDPSLQWFPFAVYIDATAQWHLATFFYESLWNFLSFFVLLTLLNKVNFKQNGMVASYYLILYGIGRMFIEGLRTDSLYLGPIRVSQALSGIFVVAGLAIIIYNTIKNKKNKDNFSKIMKVIKTDL
ncbi:MAG: prolipoprotein diacylglyceryl transferase [Candidatus Caccovivens sp.]